MNGLRGRLSSIVALSFMVTNPTLDNYLSEA